MPNMSLKKNQMPSQAADVRNKNFLEVALGYSEEQAVDEANRCLNCKNKPCVGGCPVNIDIPAFISKIRERDFEGETCAIVQALHNFDYLNLRGGLLRLDGEVIAFTFGCKATPDMFVVQIEKADHTIQGAYQMINQQFVQRNCNDVEYVNREEDLGLEGLRKAKKSYYPVMRGVKYVATPKG